MNIVEKLQAAVERARHKSDYLEKAEAALLWIGTVAKEIDIVLIISPGGNEFCTFPFPRRLKDAPRRIPACPPEKLTFIISPDVSRLPSEGEWLCVFNLELIRVYENKSRARDINPLRWGLSDTERGMASALARSALETFLLEETRRGIKHPDSEQHAAKIPPRFFLHTDIDITLWVGGKCRGSRVIERLRFHEAISRGVKAASRDPRFKPIEPYELPDVQIEITVLSPLRIPLSSAELEEEEIRWPEKGYLLETEGKQAWLIPDVFNVERFHSLQDLLALASQKANLTQYNPHTSTVRILEVESWIENEGNIYSLFGPVATAEPQSAFAVEEAISWLISLQDTDGNVSPFRTPSEESQHHVDFARSAFAMWALGEYASLHGLIDYRKNVERHFTYIKRQLEDSLVSKNSLLYIYSAEEALLLSHWTGNDSYLQDAKRWTEIAIRTVAEGAATPIMLQQLATLLINLGEAAPAAPRDVAEKAKGQFLAEQQRRGPLNLAQFAELLHVFYLLGERDGSAADYQFALAIADWIVAHRRREERPGNPPFPATTKGGLGYSRATAKIAEVMNSACQSAKRLEKNDEPYRQAIRETLRWLSIMQYDKTNTYFMQSGARPRMIGGVRNSFIDTAAWIDTVGHILLFLSRTKKGSLNRTRVHSFPPSHEEST
ncbi:MAG: AMMECR1 domain-containing protein [Candidatus Sungbacteria bacterium]|nr:AMMECR1 domain-containing protein [Candidatus Sungbacteria bacterium]